MTVILAGSVFAMSLGSSAQTTNNTFRVKRSVPEKVPKKTAPISSKSATPPAGASKDLQALEHQTAKTTTPSRSASKKAPGTSSALKPVRDKPNPAINFGGQGGKSVGMSNQGANPYRGRLRQKHAAHQ
jgi:hypothetical protein